MHFIKHIILASTMFVVFNVSEAKTILLTEDNHVVIREQITSKSTTKAANELAMKCLKSKRDLYLYLYSPGGDVLAGDEFIGFVKGLPCKVHTISSFAASMAYIIAQNLDNRYVIDSSQMMSHEATAGLGRNTLNNLKTLLKYFEDLIYKIDVNVSKRLNMSVEKYQDMIRGKDLWLTGDAAVANGHADMKVNVKCSNELLKKETVEQVRQLFGSATVTFSACPLLSSPIRIEMDDMERLHKFQRYYNFGSPIKYYQWLYNER
jgi:ATP-dependent protease ClpP protease subunit